MNCYRFLNVCSAVVLLLCWPVWASAFQGIEKIIDPELLEQTEKSLEPVPVIVTLKGCEDTKSLSFDQDVFTKMKIQSNVADIQEKVISLVSFDKGQIRHRLENLPIMGADVSYTDLKSLAGLDDVVMIEKDHPLELHTAQGLALMNTGSFRNPDSGRHVSIAIVDTGVDYSHPALGGGRFPNSKVLGGYDFGDNDADPMDNQGHGSSCAGIAAGLIQKHGDYRGGVAPGAGIYALKTKNRKGLIRTIAILKSIDWCISHQYDSSDQPIMIISMSLGTPKLQSYNYCDGEFRAEQVVFDMADANGIAVFVSSGNEANPNGIGFSACMKNTIAVGAVYDGRFGGIKFPHICSDRSTASDQVTCYSNSAPILDLLAPSHCAYTPSWPNGKYNPEFGGTSAACPYAAGAAALIQSYHKEKTGRFLSAKELRQLMIETGDPIKDQKSRLTTPRVNVTKALQALNIEGAQSQSGEESNRAIDQLRGLLQNADQ